MRPEVKKMFDDTAEGLAIISGETLHRNFERILSARRHWRAIARSLGFTKRGIHMLAKTKRDGYVFVDIDYGFNGRVDFVRVREL